VKRASYANITFFFPNLIGRLLMRLTGVRPRLRIILRLVALNGLLDAIPGAESWWLRRMIFRSACRSFASPGELEVE